MIFNWKTFIRNKENCTLLLLALENLKLEQIARMELFIRKQCWTFILIIQKIAPKIVLTNSSQCGHKSECFFVLFVLYANRVSQNLYHIFALILDFDLFFHSRLLAALHSSSTHCTRVKLNLSCAYFNISNERCTNYRRCVRITEFWWILKC